MYLPHDGIASKIFHDVVQKYLDQGMDYKSAWLAAKANNPVAFRAYSA
jgi:predicted GNAT family acetyltransferase